MTSTAATIYPLPVPSAAQLTLPGSKSEANRLLVAAALSGREVVIHGASPSDDVRHLVTGLHTLGFDARFVDEPSGTVHVGPRRADAPARGELFCGNAGTALRFLLSVAAITAGDWIVTGDAHMQKRPIGPLVDAWQALGVNMQSTGGCPPVRVQGGADMGGPNKGGAVALDPTLSSQYLSSLLLVGSQLEGGLEITFDGPLASREYAALTCTLLQRVGVRAALSATGARVHAGQSAQIPARLEVGGDWSGMGVWTCLNHLTGSRVAATNLISGSGQADEQLTQTLEQLDGNGDRTIDVEPIPDQFLNLAVVAALRNGTTRITGAANVRVKECDRVAVMARELEKLGVAAMEHPDGLTVTGGQPLHRATIDPEQDHRVAMAFALAGLVAGGVAIEQPDCVAKSYPAFWSDLERVRSQHQAIAIIGMRAAGKSTLGRTLAQQLGSPFIDTDDAFVAEHGDIATFVAAHGWPAFRKLEEEIVAASIASGRVVATGGGCIESAATRALLAERAHVVWLQADAELLRARLAKDHSRPSLTGAPLADELGEVLSRREPLYRTAADRIVDASQSSDQLVASICRPPLPRQI